MSFSRVFSMLLLGGFAATAQDTKPNLSGSWQLKEPARTASAMKVVIEQNGNAVHIVRNMTGANGKEVKQDVTCKTDGKECESGGSKISLWFDGAALMMMDAGEAVSKVSMKVDGDTLKVEVTHIYPDGEPETFILAKM